MTFKGFENENISLRALEPEDLELLYEWENDARNWVFGISLSPYSRFTLEEFIKTASYDIFINKQLRLIIESKKHKKPAGAVDLFDMDFLNRRTGIGILVDSAFRNKGIATESLNLISAYVFSILNMRQIYCYISEDNKSSIQLFEKSGFERSGSLKDWIIQQGQWKSVYLYQKLNFS